MRKRESRIENIELFVRLHLIKEQRPQNYIIYKLRNLGKLGENFF